MNRLAYGLTILYVLQTGDTKFAKELYDHIVHSEMTTYLVDITVDM